MRKRTRLTILLTAILLTGISFTTAMAGFGPGNCNGETRQERLENRMEQHLARMTTMLELTGSQQAQIKQILTTQQKQRMEQREQRWDERGEMRKMKSATAFDEASFRAMAEKRAAERIDRQVERMKTRQDILALLTPEQKEKAEVFFTAMDRPGPGHGKRR